MYFVPHLPGMLVSKAALHRTAGLHIRTFFQHHRSSQVLNALLNHIIEHTHHCDCLIFTESLTLQSLHKLQSIEMVVLLL